MKIGLVQYSPAWEDPKNNISKLDILIERDLNKEELLIFPEMSLTGFTMESDQYAEDLDGISTVYFMKLAQRLKRHIIAGVIERDEDKIFNTLIHYDKSGLITARYRKIHPFSYAKENQFYTAGKKPLMSKIDRTLIGLSICYDLRFPELYRFYGKDKADFIVNIANWPVKRIEHWKALLKARAIENQCFMIGVNRVGKDPFNEYNGCSAVFDPMGKEIELVENEEKIISVNLDLSLVEDVRNKLPFLQDIRLI